MDRREFLKVGGLGAGAASLLYLELKLSQWHYDPEFKVHYKDKVTFEEARDFSLRMGRQVQKINKSGWEPNFNEENLDEWATAIVAVMQMQGVAPTTYAPKTVEYEEFTGDYFLNTSARTFCGEKKTMVSERYLTDFDPLYHDDQQVGSFVHELGHIQQANSVIGCDLTQIDLSETSIQIATFETMAAMGIMGYKDMTLALASQLLSLGTGSALAMALVTNRIEEYKQMRAEIMPGITNKLHFELIEDARKDKYWDWLWALEIYYLHPFELITQAHRKNNDEIDGLLLPKRYKRVELTGAYFPGEELPFMVDDTVRYIANMEGLVKEALNQR